ncbi:L10-interacting MYB domain-containing protein-like protein [Tanacetum coccineum]
MDSNHDNTNVKHKSKRAASRKTVWDTSTHITFVELCLEELRNGNRPGSHFNKIGWANLENKLKAKTGKVFCKQQLKNHWDTMKKDWKLYDRLMRIESGLGWDPVRKTIDATPEWWDEKIEADPELAKFRDKNLEMYRMYYDQLFGDSVAVGDRTQLPTDFQKNNDSPSNIQEEIGAEIDAANIEGNGDGDEFSLGDSVEISFPESSSTKKKKKKKGNNSNTRSKRGKTTGVSSSFELKLDTNAWTLMDSNSDDEKNDSNDEDWMEDENTWLLLCGLVVKGIIIGHNALNKKKLACRTSCRTDLKEHYGLKATRNVSIEESLGIFLASVREHEQAKFIGRKGYATQNIMAACDFNMCFTFVWAGWEGTAHDTRIFLEALRRPQVNFPRPTGDKYYVVDAGYPNTKGYLAPYKGNDIRYHIPDFRRGQTSIERAPKGKKRHLTTITCR